MSTGLRPHHSPGSVKILLVDDEPDLLDVFSFMLKKRGYQVFTAPGALQALQILKSNPDMNLVISDQAMPELRGWDLFIRMKEFTDNPQFLLLTGSLDVTLERAYSVGMAGVLSKPVEKESLLNTIHNCLSAQLSNRKYQRIPVWLEVSVQLSEGTPSCENGIALNISEGGLFLGAVTLREVGTRLTFKFMWKEKQIQTTGRVAWVRPHESYLPKGMGISFDKPLS